LLIEDEKVHPREEEEVEKIINAKLDGKCPLRWQMVDEDGHYYRASFPGGVDPHDPENPKMQAILGQIKCAFKSCNRCGEMKAAEHFPQADLCACENMDKWCSGRLSNKIAGQKFEGVGVLRCPLCSAALSERAKRRFDNALGQLAAQMGQVAGADSDHCRSQTVC
jgi:hypothetical protein